MYESRSKKPYIVKYLNVETFHDSIDEVHREASEVDIWVKGEMAKKGYKETLGAYKEVIDRIKGELGLTKNIDSLNILKALHTYLKADVKDIKLLKKVGLL